MQGHFELGFELHPIKAGEGLFSPAGDGFEHNITWKKAQDNKNAGNKFFKDGQVTDAVGKYTEIIMQCRALEEDGVPEENQKEVRVHMATAYLNLSACFLKMGELGHAQNTALRAIQGDEDPPNPKHCVLPDASKAKAYYRRGQARQGLQNYDLAKQDYESSLKLADSTDCRKALASLSQRDKESKKKEKSEWGGFFKKGDAFGPTPEPAEKKDDKLKDTVKLREGLWMVPEGTTGTGLAESMGMESSLPANATQQAFDDEATAMRKMLEETAEKEGMSCADFIAVLKADPSKADEFAAKHNLKARKAKGEEVTEGAETAKAAPEKVSALSANQTAAAGVAALNLNDTPKIKELPEETTD